VCNHKYERLQVADTRIPVNKWTRALKALFHRRIKSLPVVLHHTFGRMPILTLLLAINVILKLIKIADESLEQH
jgi:hypothetical protein